MTPREQTERALIGCCLEQPDFAGELKSAWFDDHAIAALHLAIGELLLAGKPIDAGTVLHAAGSAPETLALILECQEQCVSTANFAHWREIIVAETQKSRMLAAAQGFISALPEANGDLRTHVSRLESVLSKPIGREAKTQGAGDCADALNHSIEHRFNNQGKRSGLLTGLEGLDKYTDGLQFGEMTIVAARPGVGKTAIACNLVNRICLEDGVPTLFLSLEMSTTALCRRMLSSREGVEMVRLKSGVLCESDMARIAMFHRRLKASPFFCREAFGGMSGQEAATIIRRASERRGVKFVVLDYLQKLKSDSKQEKRTYEVADASASLVAAVRDTKVAFVCLAQLNRESEKDKGRMPRVSDLADSGQIERDADCVLLLHRDRDEESIAAMVVGKQRDGETGTVKLHFDGRFCRFTDSFYIPDDTSPTRNLNP